MIDRADERSNAVGSHDSPLEHAVITAMIASIGAQLRAARIDHEWLLADMAVRVGLSPSVVCRMELARREASLHQLILVCAALGRRLSDIMRTAEDEAFPLGHAPWEF